MTASAFNNGRRGGPVSRLAGAPRFALLSSWTSLWRAAATPLMAVMMLGCGTAIGLAVTALVIERRIDPAAIAIGPWVTWPKVGTSDIDPYARAINARDAAVPLASAEGLTFTATTDETGARLSTRCDYRLGGASPSARYWTLTATTPEGIVMDNPAARSGFSSREILRREDGGFTIDISARARPGNWLPVSGQGRFVLTLRLYDTPLTSVASDIRKAKLPGLTPLGCAS